MGGVDHDNVHARSNQRADAFAGVFTGADRSADTQTTLVVLARERPGFGFLDVLDGHHALERELVVDDQDFFQTVLVQQVTHFVLVGAFADGDQTLFRRHHFANGDVQAGFKTDVAGGHDADELAIMQDWNAGDVVLTGQFEQVTNGRVSLDGDRILDHTRFELLDLAHFGSLLLDGHVLVDDADAAFLSHGDCQTGFSDGVHSGGNEGMLSSMPRVNRVFRLTSLGSTSE